MSSAKALFFDRDGTLIRDAHYLSDPEKVQIIEGVGKALLEAKENGFLLFMHTNQSGIARGYLGWEEVNACNQRMMESFSLPADFFAETCIAPELPEEKDGYRKPSARFEKEMILKFNLNPSKCWVVGDKWIDPQTGLNAGMQGALVMTGKPVNELVKKKAKQNEVPIYKDIPAFIESLTIDL